MTPIHKLFANCLKQTRLAQQMTQEELAIATGLSVSFIRSLEQAQSGSSFDTLNRLCNALSVKPHQLFDCQDKEHA